MGWSSLALGKGVVVINGGVQFMNLTTFPVNTSL